MELHLGLRLLVGERRELRPEVMLDLVVEPAVHEVVEVAAGTEVGRGDHLAEEEGAAVGGAARAELVEVISGVIGGDGDERVHVGGRVGEGQIGHCALVPGRRRRRQHRGDAGQQRE